MKNKIISIISLFTTSLISAQQIGDGRAVELSNFSVPLQSGVYQGYHIPGMNPDLDFGWQHLFVIRHSNDNNNHQLQLSSSYSQNDRLFFRKTTGGLGPNNPTWIELATRGSNTFNGTQFINGSQNLSGNLILGQENEISTISGPSNSGAIQIKTSGSYGGSTNRYLRLGWKDNNAFFNPVLSINDDLNVGIGTINPDTKLAVNGTIHSKEVKVDVNGWSDFVFKKEYNLPTLSEVEKQILEKGHLENIPCEEEVLKNGINLGEMNSKLLQKIEELTLYVIGHEKKSEKLEILISEQNKIISEQNKRLEKLENKQ